MRALETQIENIYHCCVQKTASQWIKAILSDEILFKKTGMTVYTYTKYLPTKNDPRKLTERTFDQSFPKQSIISPLYIDYPGYRSIPKPEQYKTFSIIRDPRDIVVSWYFSVKDIHPIMGRILEHRHILQNSSLKDGLVYCINYLNDYGLFKALKSWKNVPADDPVLLLRFEDLVDVNTQMASFKALFTHCRIPLHDHEVQNLLETYTFERMQKCTEKKGISLYRKGIQGDWENYFDKELAQKFQHLTSSLVEELGYRWS